MSESVPLPSGSTEIERLRTELAASQRQTQHVREELIRSQITVLELQDTILRRETDKADAVSLLGRAELLLESKINYIFELDRALNAQIATLEVSLAEANSAHAAITGDLVNKLDQVNKQLSAAHELAASHARATAETQDRLNVATHALHQLQAQHAQLQKESAATSTTLAACEAARAEASAAHAALEKKLHTIRTSFAWKISAPFRLFRHD
jgi:chromosome segregation ATPase